MLFRVTHTALLKRRYVAAGVALAMCLVHGGPCPRFFSTTLYSMLLGNLHSNVTLDDIHDVTVNRSLTQVRCISCVDVFVPNVVLVVNIARNRPVAPMYIYLSSSSSSLSTSYSVN